MISYETVLLFGLLTAGLPDSKHGIYDNCEQLSVFVFVCKAIAIEVSILININKIDRSLM